MFGYIAPCEAELKVRELEAFKAYYCGLCRTLKKNYGQAPALSLSNDCAFLYIVISALSGETVTAEKCRCALHPLQKRRKIITDGGEYAAAVNVMLAYAKCEDDKKDGEKPRAVYKKFIKGAYNKACAAYPQAAQAMRDMRAYVDECEKSETADVDAAAHSFAVFLGHIFEYACEEKWEELYDFGYNIGRWVYLIDAADDLEKDGKSGNYNVFLRKYAGNANEEIRREAAFSLYISLAKAKEAREKLALYKNAGIIDNIISIGLRERTEFVLKGKTLESV